MTLIIGISTLTSGIIVISIITAFVASIGVVMYIRSINTSDISSVIPMPSFVPVFLIMTGFIMLSEVPTICGIIGVLIVTIGSYILKAPSSTSEILSPMRNILNDRGIGAMLLSSVIFAILSPIDKIGITMTNFAFWTVLTTTFISIFTTPIAIKNRRFIDISLLKSLILIRIISGLIVTFQMIAFAMALLVYVVSIININILLSVIIGYYVFKEKNIKCRVIGSLVMIVGVRLIIFF